MPKANASIPGLDISPEVANALITAGYKTAHSLAIASAEDLVTEASLSNSAANEIIQKAILHVASPPMTASDLLHDEIQRGKLRTGSSALDSLLDGGIWEKEVTEISGGYATGKTQLCFQLCVNAQLPYDEGGLDGKVFFIDSEGTFSAKRVGEIALSMNLDPNQILKNIYVARALDSKHQISLAKLVSEQIKPYGIKLVIVDSIASHFRTDYVGKETMVERQQKIMQHGSALSSMAYIHGVAVVVTNQIVGRTEEFSSSTELKPALGQAWSHRPQTRIILRKTPGAARVARLVDSPRRAEGEEIFYISDAGISDRLKSG